QHGQLHRRGGIPGDSIGSDAYYDFEDIVYSARVRRSSKRLLMTKECIDMAQSYTELVKHMDIQPSKLPTLVAVQNKATLLINQGREISSVMDSWLSDDKTAKAIADDETFACIGLGKAGEYWTA
ncbi:hypothetical protein GGI12_006384, partial [Dipsacomyces acuminosporus]